MILHSPGLAPSQSWKSAVPQTFQPALICPLIFSGLHLSLFFSQIFSTYLPYFIMFPVSGFFNNIFRPLQQLHDVSSVNPVADLLFHTLLNINKCFSLHTLFPVSFKTDKEMSRYTRQAFSILQCHRKFLSPKSVFVNIHLLRETFNRSQNNRVIQVTAAAFLFFIMRKQFFKYSIINRFHDLGSVTIIPNCGPVHPARITIALLEFDEPSF